MANNAHALGTQTASEQLLRELYLELRQKLNRWAEITKQTAQARMGYIGQHLVSVVTGLPGGKSGARGRDLIYPDNAYGEIKTCYRVDQLGHCLDCSERIAAIETMCPNCRSTNIQRMDDSKWLIGIRHDEEFDEILSPRAYFLVLFDFTDLTDPSTIRASIWTVDPKVPGFALCMIDYYLNIRAQSLSKAPFNLWPFELKFGVMRPILIYRSFITADDRIRTDLFPNGRNQVEECLSPLSEYSRSRNLDLDGIRVIYRKLGFTPTIGTRQSKVDLLHDLQGQVRGKRIPNSTVADTVAYALYADRVRPHIATLPGKIRGFIDL